MRKLFILAFAALLMVAFAAPSFAAETTFNGQYKVRGWSNWNFDKKPTAPDSERGRYDGYFDQRFRLTITHTRSEFLKAVVQLDLVEDTWGQQRNFRINNSTVGNMVRKAYIEFTLPKVGTFTVGKQPALLGYGLAFADSGGLLDGLKYSNKWGPVGVSAMYFKWDDNILLGGASEFYNRDSSLWLLDLAITPNDNHTIELFGGYANYATGVPTSHFWSRVFPPSDNIHADLGLVGVAYTGEFADMITVKGEFSWLFGRADLAFMGRPNDSRLGGHNLYIDVAYHNDLMTVGAAFVYGSGQTKSGWDASHFNVNFITADEFVFGNIIASGNGGLNDAWGGGLGFCDDIENLTAAKLYFEIYPLCCDGKLSLNAAVIWAKWTEDVGLGTPYDHPVNYYTGGAFYAPFGYASTDLGWEVDFGLSYEIMEGLTYSLATGVLFTGESFDYVGMGGKQEWGPIWTVNNNLIYEF
jgi:hypothetical protein